MEEKMTKSELDDFMNTFMGISAKVEEPKEIKADGTEIPTKLNEDLDCNGREIPKTLVAVNYRDKVDKNLFAGRAYTYYTKLPLKIGDIVVCPTKFGASVGKVCRVDVPEKEVEAFKDALKEIDSYYTGEAK